MSPGITPGSSANIDANNKTITVPAFWHITYFQPYFNISTEKAVERILKAVWPFRMEKFVDTETDLDLYIPFWNFITLVITMSLLSHVLNGFYSPANSIHDQRTDNDIVRVRWCFSALSTYLGVNPIVAFLAFKFKGGNISYPALSSLYGYSLVIFLPMSFHTVCQCCDVTRMIMIIVYFCYPRKRAVILECALFALVQDPFFYSIKRRPRTRV